MLLKCFISTPICTTRCVSKCISISLTDIILSFYVHLNIVGSIKRWTPKRYHRSKEKDPEYSQEGISRPLTTRKTNTTELKGTFFFKNYKHSQWWLILLEGPKKKDRCCKYYGNRNSKFFFPCSIVYCSCQKPSLQPRLHQAVHRNL